MDPAASQLQKSTLPFEVTPGLSGVHGQTGLPGTLKRQNQAQESVDDVSRQFLQLSDASAAAGPAPISSHQVTYNSSTSTTDEAVSTDGQGIAFLEGQAALDAFDWGDDKVEDKPLSEDKADFPQGQAALDAFDWGDDEAENETWSENKPGFPQGQAALNAFDFEREEEPLDRGEFNRREKSPNFAQGVHIPGGLNAEHVEDMVGPKVEDIIGALEARTNRKFPEILNNAHIYDVSAKKLSAKRLVDMELTESLLSKVRVLVSIAPGGEKGHVLYDESTVSQDELRELKGMYKNCTFIGLSSKEWSAIKTSFVQFISANRTQVSEKHAEEGPHLKIDNRRVEENRSEQLPKAKKADSKLRLEKFSAVGTRRALEREEEKREVEKHLLQERIEEEAEEKKAEKSQSLTKHVIEKRRLKEERLRQDTN